MDQLRQLIDDARRALVVDRVVPSWWNGARVMVIVVVPLVVSVVVDRLDIGLPATLGALNAGLADPGGLRRVRANAMIAASVAMTVAIALSTVVVGAPWLATVVLALWTLVLALAGNAGPGAPGVAFVATVVFIIGLGLPDDPSAVVLRSVSFAVGCVWALLVTVSVWPLRRDQTVRVEFAAAFGLMAEYIRAAPHSERERSAGRDEVADALRSARLTLARRNAASNRATATVSMVNAADVIERTLGAIDRALADVAPGEIVPELVDAVTVLAATCDEVADAIRAGREWHGAALARAVRRLDATALHGDAAIARDALDLVVSGLSESPRTPVAAGDLHPDGLRQRVRVLVDPNALVFRHAVRLALLVGLAQVVAFNDSLGKSYWIPLTVVVVLKPDLGSTLDRAVQRTIGTVLGAVLAFAAVSAADGRTWILVCAFAVSVFWTLAMIEENYALGVIGLTPAVIVLLAIDGGGPVLVADRLAGTLLGGALALIGAVVLWPLWARRTLAGQLATAATAADVYLDDAVDPRVPVDDVRAAHRRAERARSDAESLQRRMLSEPRRDRIAPTDVVGYCTALAALIESTTQLRATWRVHERAVGSDLALRTPLRGALHSSHQRLRVVAASVFGDGTVAIDAPVDPASFADGRTVAEPYALIVARIDALTTTMVQCARRVAVELEND